MKRVAVTFLTTISLTTMFTSTLTGCATAAELRERDKDVAIMIDRIGSRTFGEDATTVRTATERAFLTLGYDVLWSDDQSLGTGAFIEQRSQVGTIVETSRGKAVNVGVTQSNEVLSTRSYNAFFEPLADGRTRVRLVPKVKIGTTDVTAYNIVASRRLGREYGVVVRERRAGVARGRRAG